MELAEITNIFEIAAAVATIGGVGYGLFEWQRQRDNMREQSALAMYSRNLELAIKEPLLWRTDFILAGQASAPDIDRYMTYSALLFATAEQLFLTRGDDVTWKKTISALLLPHLHAARILGTAPRFDQFDKEFMKFIDEECLPRANTTE